MEPNLKKTFLEYKIQKSKETIEDARVALDSNRLSMALNRIYYAIFHIVSALAKKFDYSTLRHKQLMGWFNHNFVKTGNVSKEMSDLYKNAFDNRQETDYEGFVVYEKDDVEQYFNEMLVFVSEIGKIISPK